MIPQWFGINHEGIVRFPYQLEDKMTQPNHHGQRNTFQTQSTSLVWLPAQTTHISGRWTILMAPSWEGDKTVSQARHLTKATTSQGGALARG